MKKWRTLITALGLAGSLGIAQGHSNAAKKPNFIFFIADDVSQEDIGCYGHPSIKTPNIDALAANGMRFKNAYLTVSSCSPSRCSILTGRYPHNTGAPELHTKLPSAQVRFPELLRESGYYTVLSGKNHMVGNKDRCFDEITKGGGPGKEEDWVAHVQKRPKNKPFFFWFAANDAHRPWDRSEGIHFPDIKDVIVPPYLVDTNATRMDLAEYYHEVSRFDHYIGLIKRELEKQKVLDNTLIVVAADNGRPFPRSKARLFDSGIKTPWIVHFPDMVKKAGVSDSLVSSIDLSATCLELAGIKKTSCIQGVSFIPILKNPKQTVREMVFAEQNWHVYKNHSRLVRFGNFAYIKNSYSNQANLSTESDDTFPAGNELWKAHAAGKTNAKQQQVFVNPCPTEELYNVSRDPDQFVNLASNPEYTSVLKKARTQLEMWGEQTGDSVPKKPTLNRFAAPFIKDGSIIKPKRNKANKVRGEMPGDATNATGINHPGPIILGSGLK